MGVVIEGWNLLEAEVFIECTCSLHVIQRIQQDAAISGAARCVEDCFRQLTTQSQTSERRPYIQTFHFCRIAVVRTVQRAKRTTTCDFAVHLSQQQSASWFRVFAGQLTQLFLKVLKAQIDLQRLCVFQEDRMYLFDIRGRQRR